jgi:hypothetical protein
MRQILCGSVYFIPCRGLVMFSWSRCSHWRDFGAGRQVGWFGAPDEARPSRGHRTRASGRGQPPRCLCNGGWGSWQDKV